MSSDWLDDTACTPEWAWLFDEPERNTLGGFDDYEKRLDAARKLCARCPVAGRCLEEGLTTGGTGIFAGQLLIEGEPRVALRPGRKPKDTAA